MRKIALSLTLSAMAVLTSTTLMAANTQMILNQTPTPVKGIWYALAQKFNGIPKYSGGFATYTANHTPMAIDRNGDVYYTFAQDGPAGTMQVGVAVLRGSTAQTSVQILRTEMASRDPHQNVTLSIDDAGYVYVYQSARNNDPAPSMQGLIWKSVTPYTLPTASHLLGAGHNRAYLQPWHIAGQQVQVFTQYAGELNGPKVRHPSVYNPSCHSAAGARLFDAGGYAISLYKNNRLHVVHNFHRAGEVTFDHPTIPGSQYTEYGASHPDLRSNLYYMYSDDGGCQWKNIQGQVVSLPVNPQAAPTQIYNSFASGKPFIYLQDLDVQADGSVVVLAVDSSHYSPVQGSREHVVYKITPAGAYSRQVLRPTNHNYNVGFLFQRLGETFAVLPDRSSGFEQYSGGNLVVMRDIGTNWAIYLGCNSTSLHGHYNYARRILNGTKYIGLVGKTAVPDIESENTIHLLSIGTRPCIER